MSLSDQEIIEGLKQASDKVIKYCFNNFYNSAEYVIYKHQGTKHDANDIFQEALLSIFENPPKYLVCSFRTYLLSVCKKKWVYEQRNRKQFPEANSPLIEECNNSEEKVLNIKKLIEDDSKYDLYIHHFAELDSQCQEILTLFNNKVSIGEIAQITGFSPGYIKKRKFLCKQELIRRICNDERYNNLNLNNHD